jgi:hypothetical protein
MGEPAVPDVETRKEALATAEGILEAIRDDVSGEWLSKYDRVLWLLASSLVYCVKHGPESDGDPLGVGGAR